ncbi:MAG: T9SS type A sorting domain-containing protein [Flavobacteriales bacterium]
MVKNIALSAAALAAWMILSVSCFAQIARVQFIHNASDTSLQQVDIRLNGATWASDIDFHEATAMMTVAASDSSFWEVRDSEDSTITYYSWSASLPAASNHIFILNGHLNESNYSPGRALSIHHFSEAIENSASATSVDILFFQGATEFDSIDVAESQLFQLTAFDNLPYGSFSGYINLFSADYGWSIQDASNNQPLGDFSLPVSSLNWAGEAITIVNGGYFNQSSNSNGQALGMWATTANGGPMVCLQPLQWELEASVQFLHSANLPASSSIRIETDDATWIQTIEQHEASTFIPFPAGKDVVLTIHSNLLAGPIDSIWSDTLHLLSGNSYQLIWFGTETEAHLYTQLVEQANHLSDTQLQLSLFHGASQWPVVSVLADTLLQTPIFTDVAYGFSSDTLTIQATNDEWLIYSATDSITAVYAPLETIGLQQRRVTMLTHSLSDSPTPSVWLSTDLGGPMTLLNTLVIPDPPVYCEMQFIHTSADTSLQQVDVWVQDSIVLPAFSFESASAFISVQCNEDIHIRVTKVNQPLVVLLDDTLQLQANQLHRAYLWGIYDTEGYNPSPALDWKIQEDFTTNASNQDQFDIHFFHGATDLGNLQINEASIPIVPFFTIVEPGEISNTQSLEASENFGIELRNYPTQFLYGTYALPSADQLWVGENIAIVSTGFRQPANNSNGQPLRIWSIKPNGIMTELPLFVDINEIDETSDLHLYPNPASNRVQIQLPNNLVGSANLQITSIEGRLLHQEDIVIGSERTPTFSTESLPNGMYLVSVLHGGVQMASLLSIQHARD